METEKPADELRRRRERGRQSQASFRKRQAAATRQLKDENRRLKGAITKIINATHVDEYSDLLESIFDAVEEAGIEAERPVRRGITKDHTGHLVNSQRRRDHVDIEKDAAVYAMANAFVQNSSDEKRPGSGLSSLPSINPPRLTSGAWLDPMHYTRSPLPPEDIIPYLGNGSKTFAGRLFWSFMEHKQIGCKHSHPELPVLMRGCLSHSNITKDANFSFIQATMEARREFARTGTISMEHAAAGEADLGLVLRDHILKEYHAEGKDPRSWLSCIGIEERVKSMFGNDNFRLLERAARGEGGSGLQETLSNMNCRLYNTASCFGDGPRWNVNVVDSLFLELVGKVTSASAK
ncbi:hypothetical protein BKA56DRAFT_594692 [Ilyonectria sp. MPI-CAGE-AT-0026]|nr:hypothetical protein BKA56DRAFT_594692 [Ilyonectria sp. MPI-CAGE-AT-0026]